MSARCGVDELGVDSHTVIGPTNAALKHISHAEFFRDLPNLHGLPFVRKCRVASDDEETGDFGEIGDQVVGHAVGEIFLFRVAVQILERKHRNGGLIGQWIRHPLLGGNILHWRSRAQVEIPYQSGPYS